jgi:hypothetical protein
VITSTTRPKCEKGECLDIRRVTTVRLIALAQPEVKTDFSGVVWEATVRRGDDPDNRFLARKWSVQKLLATAKPAPGYEAWFTPPLGMTLNPKTRQLEERKSGFNRDFRKKFAVAFPLVRVKAKPAKLQPQA